MFYFSEQRVSEGIRMFYLCDLRVLCVDKGFFRGYVRGTQ